MGVTHATISRRIADLERGFGGTPLFERSRLGYILTSSGRAALLHAKAMSAAAEGFAREVTDADAMSGSVRVSATAALIEWKIAAAVSKLIDKFPQLEIEVVAENRNVSLAMREADIAVRLGRPRSGDAVARKIGTISYRLFGTSKYIRSKPRDSYRVFTFSDPVKRETIPRALAAQVPGQEARLALPSFTAQAAAALSGTGLAMLPIFLGSQMSGLAVVDEPETGWDQEVWLLTHRDARRFQRVRIVAEAIAATFED